MALSVKANRGTASEAFGNGWREMELSLWLYRYIGGLGGAGSGRKPRLSRRRVVGLGLLVASAADSTTTRSATNLPMQGTAQPFEINALMVGP